MNEGVEQDYTERDKRRWDHWTLFSRLHKQVVVEIQVITNLRSNSWRAKLYYLYYWGCLLRSDPTGSGRTKGRRKDRVRRTAIDCPPQNACRRNEYKNRGDRRRPEPSWRIRAFRRTSDRDEGEVSNISSEVLEYKYTRYIY